MPAFSQAYIPSKGDVERFFSTKTLVVLEDNLLYEYNTILTDVMNKEWTITEYDFITASEFEEKRREPDYSFLYVSRITFEKDKTDASYRFLCLSLGGDYYRLNEMPEIAAVPLSYYNVEEDSYHYKLAVLVRFLQNHALLVREKPEILSANVLNYYNNNMKEIKNKTLYLIYL